MRPNNLEIAHAFMLEFQRKNNRPPSLAEMAEALPFWKTRAGAQQARNRLKAQGLIEARRSSGWYLELWAIDRE